MTEERGTAQAARYPPAMCELILSIVADPPASAVGSHTGALPPLPMAFGEDGKTLPSPGDSNCRLLPPPLEPLDDQQGAGG